MGIELSRRRVLQAAAALGVVGTASRSVDASVSSPDLEKFVQPMPIPEVLDPDGTRRGADYYEVSMEEFERRVHPDLPPTTLWGFEGSAPGPVIRAGRNERIKLRFDNALPDEHLFEIDDRIAGTSTEDYDDFDGSVPDVRTVIHQHGLNVEWQSDGQAEAWKSPGGVTGPRFEKHVHDIPNRQPRMTSTYHDHALGVSRLNNYAGLSGFYVVEDEAEDRLALPSGEYDVPIMLQDRTFEADGSLHYPDEFVPNVAGDTAFVNGAVWPYLEVEPRRYRFRLVNGSNGRTFDLSLANDDGGDVPTLYQFAPDQGYLEEVVPVGPGGRLESLIVAPFERAEVVVDFSAHAGETITVTNDAAFPFSGGGGSGMDGDGDGHGGGGEHGGGHGDGHEADELSEVMQFRVADSAAGVRDDSADPATLDLPTVPEYEERAAVETRRMTLGMKTVDGLPTHVLNGKTFHDEGGHPEPQLGTTEVWEFENETMHTHPMHMHLVEFRVVGRGPDGTREPDPNERGPKDVVRVDPGETVRILTRFGDFTGTYPWHCHILEHEAQAMMRPFEVVAGNADDSEDAGDEGGERGRDDEDERGRGGGGGKGCDGR